MKVSDIQEGFIPSKLANCTFWIPINQTSLITVAGNLVTNINDLSGQNCYVQPPAANKRPRLDTAGLNGRPTLIFDTNDRLLSCPTGVILPTTNVPFSLFVVFNTSNNLTAIGGIISQYDDGIQLGDFSLQMNVDETISLEIGGVVLFTTAASYNDGDTHLISLIKDSSDDYKFYIDNVLLHTVNDANAITDIEFVIGGKGSSAVKSYRGKISDIIIYNRAVMDSEKDDIFQYEKDFWGI